MGVCSTSPSWAQNLMLFLQIGDGVDDETWQYHLRQGDFSRWFREAIKDENLASAAEQVESSTKAHTTGKPRLDPGCG